MLLYELNSDTQFHQNFGQLMTWFDISRSSPCFFIEKNRKSLIKEIQMITPINTPFDLLKKEHLFFFTIHLFYI